MDDFLPEVKIFWKLREAPNPQKKKIQTIPQKTKILVLCHSSSVRICFNFTFPKNNLPSGIDKAETATASEVQQKHATKNRLFNIVKSEQQ